MGQNVTYLAGPSNNTSILPALLAPARPGARAPGARRAPAPSPDPATSLAWSRRPLHSPSSRHASLSPSPAPWGCLSYLRCTADSLRQRPSAPGPRPLPAATKFPQPSTWPAAAVSLINIHHAALGNCVNCGPRPSNPVNHMPPLPDALSCPFQLSVISPLVIRMLIGSCPGYMYVTNPNSLQPRACLPLLKELKPASGYECRRFLERLPLNLATIPAFDFSFSFLIATIFKTDMIALPKPRSAPSMFRIRLKGSIHAWRHLQSYDIDCKCFSAASVDMYIV